MPLSGSFSVIYSFSPGASQCEYSSSVSSFASNAKGDQSFPLQTSAEKSTHHLEVVWPNEQIWCCAKNVIAQWTLRLVFGSNFINEITRILEKCCNDGDNDERACIYPMTYVTVMTPQLFPHTATPTSIHHFSEYSLVCQHVSLTISIRRCLENLVNWPLPMQRYFALWWDLDHDLKLRVRLRNRSPQTHKLCIAN